MIWNFSSSIYPTNLYVVKNNIKNVNVFIAYTYNIFKKFQEASLLHNIIQMMSSESGVAIPLLYIY